MMFRRTKKTVPTALMLLLAMLAPAQARARRTTVVLVGCADKAHKQVGRTIEKVLKKKKFKVAKAKDLGLAARHRAAVVLRCSVEGKGHAWTATVEVRNGATGSKLVTATFEAADVRKLGRSVKETLWKKIETAMGEATVPADARPPGESDEADPPNVGDRVAPKKAGFAGAAKTPSKNVVDPGWTEPAPKARRSTTAKASAPAGAAWPESVSDDAAPGGIWATAGLATYTSGGGSIFRLDVGMPGLLSSVPWLVVHLPVYYSSESFSLLGDEYVVMRILLLPGVQREWFVVKQAPGLSLITEAGVGPVINRVKTPDLPFMPGGWETNVWLGLRAAGAVRYTFPFGLMLQLQPVGLAVTLGGGQTSSAFEIAAMAGYRWK